MSSDTDLKCFRGGLITLSEHGYDILDLFAYYSDEMDEDGTLIQLSPSDVQKLVELCTTWLKEHVGACGSRETDMVSGKAWMTASKVQEFVNTVNYDKPSAESILEIVADRERLVVLVRAFERHVVKMINSEYQTRADQVLGGHDPLVIRARACLAAQEK